MLLAVPGEFTGLHVTSSPDAPKNVWLCLLNEAQPSSRFQPNLDHHRPSSGTIIHRWVSENSCNVTNEIVIDKAAITGKKKPIQTPQNAHQPERQPLPTLARAQQERRQYEKSVQY